jgi:hypothetical protein
MPLPSVRNKALGKELFADKIFAGCSLPSATLGKGFAECFPGFAECLGHSVKGAYPVVHDDGHTCVQGFLVLCLSRMHQAIVRCSNLLIRLKDQSQHPQKVSPLIKQLVHGLFRWICSLLFASFMFYNILYYSFIPLR